MQKKIILEKIADLIIVFYISMFLFWFVDILWHRMYIHIDKNWENKQYNLFSAILTGNKLIDKNLVFV